MASLQANLINFIFSKMPASDGDFVKERENNAKMKIKKPKDIEIVEKDLNGFPADFITKRGNEKGIIFYIHGGGFTTGSARERRSITQYLVSKYGYDCISINYRLAPENKWPAALDDCVCAYEKVLEGCDSKELVLMGESAGGSLVLSLGLKIKEKGLHMPKAIVAFSPSTDLYEDLPSHKGNIRTDYMLKDAISRGLHLALFDHDPDESELKDPLLSPYYGDYEGLPPIFLAASDSETLLDDSIVLYNKLFNQGHNVKLSVGHDLIHAYPMFPFLPETKDCLKEVFSFLGSL